MSRFAPSVLLCVLALLLMPAVAQAAEVALPPQAITEGVSGAVWIDLEALTPEKVLATTQLFEELFGSEDSADDGASPLAGPLPGTGDLSGQKALELYQEAYPKLREAGIQALVVPLDMNRGQADDDEMAEESLQAAPPADDEQPVYLYLAPGTDTAQVEQTLKDVLTQAADTVEAQGDSAQAEQMRTDMPSVTAVGDRWALLGKAGQEAVAPPPGQPSAEMNARREQITQVLSGIEGAPIRLAWIMTDDAREKLGQTLMDPQAGMFAGVGQPLLAMEHLTAGMWLGEQPEMKLALVFGNAQQANEFRTGINQMVTMMGQMMLMAPTQGAAQTQAVQDYSQAAQGLLAKLLLQQDQASVTLQLDRDFLQQLHQFKTAAETLEAEAGAAAPGGMGPMGPGDSDF